MFWHNITIAAWAINFHVYRLQNKGISLIQLCKEITYTYSNDKHKVFAIVSAKAYLYLLEKRTELATSKVNRCRCVNLICVQDWICDIVFATHVTIWPWFYPFALVVYIFIHSFLKTNMFGIHTDFESVLWKLNSHICKWCCRFTQTCHECVSYSNAITETPKQNVI